MHTYGTAYVPTVRYCVRTYEGLQPEPQLKVAAPESHGSSFEGQQYIYIYIYIYMYIYMHVLYMYIFDPGSFIDILRNLGKKDLGAALYADLDLQCSYTLR